MSTESIILAELEVFSLLLIIQKALTLLKSDSDDSEVEYEERMATERYDEKAVQVFKVVCSCDQETIKGIS